MEKYPVLNEDIFYGKQTSTGLTKICNTTTEKEFEPNAATTALLDLCTGTHCISEIVTALSEQSGEPAGKVAASVNNILTVLQKNGIITLESTPFKKSGKAKHITVQYPLISAEIEITNACNLRCLHCVNKSGHPYPDELTTKEIFAVIDALSGLGVYQLMISGGEPLLHPDLFDIIEYARKAPMIVDIFTNATLITEEHIKKFKKLNVRRFCVSIDSMDEHTHDTFRGKKGALKKTLQTVNLLKDEFPVCPYVSVTQLNKKGILDLLQYFRKNKFTHFQVVPVRFSGRGVTHILITPEEYYQVVVEEMEYLKREFPEGIRTSDKKEGVCGIAKSMIGIHADGTILPCPGCIKDMGVGNVRETEVKKVWETSTILETIRNTTTQHAEACQACVHLPSCSGCMANAFVLERTFTCYDPYVCALKRARDAVFKEQSFQPFF